MGRKERLISEEQKVDEVINSCDCIRIGLMEGAYPYIVPLNFGMELKDGKRVFYCHGAGRGKKKDLLLTNEYAGFELDTAHELVTNEDACEFTYGYQSVIGHGKVSEITDPVDKSHALDVIVRHYSQMNPGKYPEKMLSNMLVFQIAVEELTCKINDVHPVES